MKSKKFLSRKYSYTTKKNIAKLCALFLSCGIILPPDVSAAEDNAASYSLDTTIVTATRTEKRDLDVPMSTEVVTAEDISESGARNAAEALQKLNGFEYGAFGPMGAAMGTMSNEVNIRGVDNGVLVLLNGNPVSLRGKYNLQEIAADSIERIEIVKGGGSVLYGSEAMAGVVNIITKTKGENSVRVGFGNHGQQLYGVNLAAQGFTFNFHRNSARKFGGVSYSDLSSGSSHYGTTRTDLKDIVNQGISVGYKFNDHLSFLYGHYDTKANYERFIDGVDSSSKENLLGEQFNGREYTTKRDTVQLNYRDKRRKAGIYYNNGFTESEGPTYYTTRLAASSTPRYNTRERNTNYGFDYQQNWGIGKGVLTAGLSGQHEIYKSLASYSTKDPASYSRNNWGVFAQWDQKIDKKNSFIIGGRETWTSGTKQNYNNFSAAGQFLHKMDKNNSLYLNISQSFIMPSFANMYKSGDVQIPNPGLKPQKGINYEIGWKNISGGHKWKAALFLTRIDDNISATWNSSNTSYTYENEKFRNEGLELSYALKTEKGLSYYAGLTWQNPRRKSDNKDYWDAKFGKIQLTGAIGYKRDKWNASLQGSFLGSRVGIVSSGPSVDRKPYLLTSLVVGYAPTKQSKVTLTVNNILNRKDIISNSSSSYYGEPRTFMVDYKHTF